MSYSATNPAAKTREYSSSLHAPHTFESAIKDSKGPILGSVLTFPSTITAKLAARSGLQWVLIDMEHSPHSAAQATDMCHVVLAASQGACLPIIRVPSHGVEWIKWALDSGAAGIVVPMVNTAEEMEAIINKALYPPRGARSWGPFHAPFGSLDPKVGFPEYYQRAQSREIAILPIIESREGAENVEAIMSVDGVTGVFIGPSDLRLSMGGVPTGPIPSSNEQVEKDWNGAMDKVVATAKRLGKVVGSMGMGAEFCRKQTERGMDFLVSSIDYNALASGYRINIENARAGIDRATKL
jgi:4-hydroxy-2-oxoheptanedioate aldolase